MILSNMLESAGSRLIGLQLEPVKSALVCFGKGMILDSFHNSGQVPPSIHLLKI